MPDAVPPQSTSKIESIEASRGIAAILVVLAHASMFATWASAGQAPLGGLFVFGGNGVDFFFVLSGYIITRVHRSDVGNPKKIGRYAWRRFTRVMPPYWAATIISLPLAIHYQAGYRADIHWSFDFIVKNVFLLPMSDYPIIAPAWSLPHEMAFYTLFGIAILNRYLGIAIGVAWLAAIAAAAAGVGPSALLFQPPDGEFFLGVLVACLPVRDSPLLVIVGLLGFGGECVAEWLGSPLALGSIFSHAALGLSSAALVAGLAGSRMSFGKIGATLGGASYAIYLAHYPAIGALHLHPPSGSPEVIFLIYTATGIVAGLGFHAIVEAPLLAKLRVLTSHQHRVSRQRA